MFYSKNKVYACKSRCQPTPTPRTGLDQPAQTRSLISAFVITGTVAEQAGLNLTLSEDRVSHAHIYLFYKLSTLIFRQYFACILTSKTICFCCFLFLFNIITSLFIYLFEIINK